MFSPKEIDAVNEIKDIIDCGMIWSNTNEGNSYWRKVKERLLRITKEGR